MEHSSPAGGARLPFFACAAFLVALAWVVRAVVDRNGGYFSANEFRAWLTIMSVVGCVALIVGIGWAKRPLGRGIVLGTVAAGLIVGAALLIEALSNAA